MPFIFLATEVSKLFSHITKFICGSSEKCWKQMFSLKENLEIGHILQLVEYVLCYPFRTQKTREYFQVSVK